MNIKIKENITHERFVECGIVEGSTRVNGRQIKFEYAKISEYRQKINKLINKKKPKISQSHLSFF